MVSNAGTPEGRRPTTYLSRGGVPQFSNHAPPGSCKTTGGLKGPQAYVDTGLGLNWWGFGPHQLWVVETP